MLDDLLFRYLLYIETRWLAADDALFVCIVDMPSLLSLGSVKFDGWHHSWQHKVLDECWWPAPGGQFWRGID